MLLVFCIDLLEMLIVCGRGGLKDNHSLTMGVVMFRAARPLWAPCLGERDGERQCEARSGHRGDALLAAANWLLSERAVSRLCTRKANGWIGLRSRSGMRYCTDSPVYLTLTGMMASNSDVASTGPRPFMIGV